MSFKILYVTATLTEAGTMNKIRDKRPVPPSLENIEICTLVTGVGSAATAWTLKEWIQVNGKPDLAINAGIAGSFSNKYIIGDIVMPSSDCFADSGIEEGDKFFTLQEAGLASMDEFPYKDGNLYVDNIFIDKLRSILKPVKAITVNTATGSDSTREKLIQKFNPDIETMEGATFFYICSRENVPFLALRAISNKVEPRNRNNWNIELALNNLSEKLLEVILMLL
jgi:futalosine hydrolase